jgi:hypothetical protein
VLANCGNLKYTYLSFETAKQFHFLEQIRALDEIRRDLHHRNEPDLVNREYSIVVVCIAESNPLLNKRGVSFIILEKEQRDPDPNPCEKRRFR